MAKTKWQKFKEIFANEPEPLIIEDEEPQRKTKKTPKEDPFDRAMRMMEDRMKREREAEERAEARAERKWEKMWEITMSGSAKRDMAQFESMLGTVINISKMIQPPPSAAGGSDLASLAVQYVVPKVVEVFGNSAAGQKVLAGVAAQMGDASAVAESAPNPNQQRMQVAQQPQAANGMTHRPAQQPQQQEQPKLQVHPLTVGFVNIALPAFVHSADPDPVAAVLVNCYQLGRSNQAFMQQYNLFSRGEPSHIVAMLERLSGDQGLHTAPHMVNWWLAFQSSVMAGENELRQHEERIRQQNAPQTQQPQPIPQPVAVPQPAPMTAAAAATAQPTQSVQPQPVPPQPMPTMPMPIAQQIDEEEDFDEGEDEFDEEDLEDLEGEEEFEEAKVR